MGVKSRGSLSREATVKSEINWLMMLEAADMQQEKPQQRLPTA
jgi:hypothetical protein